MEPPDDVRLEEILMHFHFSFVFQKKSNRKQLNTLMKYRTK